MLDHQPLIGSSAGVSYKLFDFTYNLDAIYSSGLRAGFANLEKLPDVIQLNAGVERDIEIPGIGKITDRLTALNLLNRINLIRPAEGIGIFQAAYSPRLTLLNTVTVPF